MKSFRSRNYLVAVPFVLVAWAFQAWIGGSFGEVFAFAPFLFAAILVSWLGGSRATLFAAFIGYLVITYRYITPGTFLISGKDNLAALAIYVSLSISSGLLAEFFHRSRRESQLLAERLQVIFQSLSDAVIVTDPSGTITKLNPVAAKVTGWSEQEAIGKPFAAIVSLQHDLLGTTVDSSVTRMFRDGEGAGQSNLAILARRDGSTIPIEESAAPVRDAEGRTLGAVIVFRDATEKRRAAAALALLDHVYDTAPVGLGLVDRDLRYIRINRHLAAMDGRTPEESLGRTLRELVPELADRLEPLYQRILATGEPILSREIRGKTPADPNEDHDWLANYYPVRNLEGVIVGVSSVIIDITQRKRAEEALHDADRRKNEFLAMLAHELRNPLATIRYATNLARASSTAPETYDWSTVIDRQVEHLARLVDDLLEVSRITRGQIHLQRQAVDANAIIRRTVDAVRPVMADRRHVLQIELESNPLVINADTTRIEQVLQNLLYNAAKYTEPGGKVLVTSRAMGTEVVITVTDTGVGMPPELIPRVFDMFIQGERTLDRCQGGLGIGLTLVRQIVEMHGGTVSATSEGVGRGSSFAVHLPISDQPLQSVTPKTACPQRSEPRRILVVEDNLDGAQTLKTLLQTAGHEVAVCHDGLEALTAARSFMPEVVLLDIGLPGKDGYQIARELREDPLLQKTLIVALSGYGQDSDRERTRAAGFDFHLVKPIDFQTLRATIQRES